MRGLLLQFSSDNADGNVQVYGEGCWSVLGAGSWLC